MVVVDTVDDPVKPCADALLGLEVEYHAVHPVLGERPEQVAGGDQVGHRPARPVDEALDQQDRDDRHEHDQRDGPVHPRELLEQGRVEHPRRCTEDLAAAEALEVVCAARCHTQNDTSRAR